MELFFLKHAGNKRQCITKPIYLSSFTPDKETIPTFTMTI